MILSIDLRYAEKVMVATMIQNTDIRNRSCVFTRHNAYFVSDEHGSTCEGNLRLLLQFYDLYFLGDWFKTVTAAYCKKTKKQEANCLGFHVYIEPDVQSAQGESVACVRLCESSI